MQKPTVFTHSKDILPTSGTVTLYGLTIFCGSRSVCEKKLLRILSEKRALPFLVFTPNLEMLSSAKHDPTVRSMLAGADLLLPDGIGVRLLSGFRVSERITGIEIGEFLLSCAEQMGYRVYLLGGKGETAKKAAVRLCERFPALRVVGTHDGYFETHEESAITDAIRAASPDLLFVCMGFPRQESFLIRNKIALGNVRIAIGLGGSLDVWSGNVQRAPHWMQHCGLEWLFRVLYEPKRIHRLLKSVYGIFSLPIDRIQNHPK